MSRHENGPRPVFQEIPGYPDPALSPANIVHETHEALDKYYDRTSGIIDLGSVRGTLRETTIPFLHRAQIGLLANIHEIDRLGLISPEDYAFVRKRQERYKDQEVTDLEEESFRFSLVTFSFMPELSDHPLLPMGYSRGGMLKPPETVREFLERIDELGMTTAKIATGVASPEKGIERDMAVWRTYHFFETGSRLPFKFAESPQELMAREKDNLNRLLDGVPIDL